jgi:hypothetical protein
MHSRDDRHPVVVDTIPAELHRIKISCANRISMCGIRLRIHTTRTILLILIAKKGTRQDARISRCKGFNDSND